MDAYTVLCKHLWPPLDLLEEPHNWNVTQDTFAKAKLLAKVGHKKLWTAVLFSSVNFVFVNWNKTSL